MGWGGRGEERLLHDQGKLRGQGVAWVPASGSWQMLPTEVGRAHLCGGWSSSSTQFCLLLSERQLLICALAMGMLTFVCCFLFHEGLRCNLYKRWGSMWSSLHPISCSTNKNQLKSHITV